MSISAVVPANSLQAYFLPDVVVLRTPNGTYHPTSYQSFLGVLTTRQLETPFLPPGTRYYTSTGPTECVLLERPPGRAVITIAPRETKSVVYSLPLPTLVAHVTISDQRLSRFAVYAAARFPVALDDPLYHCPLPNVSPGSSGLVCFGVVNLPERLTVSKAGLLLETFLNSPFNLDYATSLFNSAPLLEDDSPLGRLWRTRGFYDPLDVYAVLQDYAEFPVTLLHPVDLTVAQLISRTC